MPDDVLDMMIRRLELMLMRQQLVLGLCPCDPDVLPAALCWLDGEIEALSL